MWVNFGACQVNIKKWNVTQTAGFDCCHQMGSSDLPKEEGGTAQKGG